MMLALAGTVAAYVVLAILLLSLNIVSLWRWWIKAGAIVITTLAFVGFYFAVAGLVGWPSHDALPARFALLHTQLVEPDKSGDHQGHIYLWVQEIDDHQLPVAAPRAYEVAYSQAQADEVQKGQDRLDAGEKVLGQTQELTDNAATAQGEPGRQDRSEGGDVEAGGQVSNNASGTAGDLDTPTIVFSPMPPVALPDKAPIVMRE